MTVVTGRRINRMRLQAAGWKGAKREKRGEGLPKKTAQVVVDRLLGKGGPHVS